ncbi:uncharacterized protein SOCE26_027020 [Sorangium cellulosum]|uniref:Alpha/beta hydrolase n=1 Tax=Sorangium cellulosum TaxID=56 RepID=A0A2L0EPV2_SORCE|nr:hypothetical protein [Sorangium cellulosum]AUX41292.1 uncharacterized protein SOCE26_027020 [Sorangium cellulosum]
MTSHPWQLQFGAGVPPFVVSPDPSPGPTGDLSAAPGRRTGLGRGALALAAAAALAAGGGCIAEPVAPDAPSIEADPGLMPASGGPPDMEAIVLEHRLWETFHDACDAAVRSLYGAAFAGSCDIERPHRRIIDADNHIAEYTVDVQVGPGARDVIGLHRVVREKSRYRPAELSEAVMLVHGDAWPFRGAFLDAPDRNTFAEFLAREGIDVWGIDLRWTRVPAGTADTSFMSAWGMEKDADDLGIALSIARVNRDLTREAPAHSAGSKIKLLGWSRGGQLAYAYAGRESQVPILARRHVDGIIPVDIYLKTDLSTPEGQLRRDYACERLDVNLAQYNDTSRSDRYYSSLGSVISALGGAALADPTGASPILAGMSNRQAALLAGQATYLLEDGRPPTPFYHLVGGTFDTNGLPVDLTYLTDESRWFSVEAQAAPYQPIKGLIDSERAMCGDPGPTIADHLGAITVPVLYVGAGGGFGQSGVYTTTLLGSTDRSSIVQSAPAAGGQLGDIGHNDIFLADDAKDLFWNGIRDWILAR